MTRQQRAVQHVRVGEEDARRITQARPAAAPQRCAPRSIASKWHRGTATATAMQVPQGGATAMQVPQGGRHSDASATGEPPQPQRCKCHRGAATAMQVPQGGRHSDANRSRSAGCAAGLGSRTF
eukprot:466849-Prymnesium_polylepis.1